MTKLNKVICLNDETFKKNVLQNNGVFLIDFWAKWCGPCKAIAPILEEIADEFSDKLTIFKLNIEENPEITKKYNIRSIPTLLLFCKGKVIATKIGALSKKQLKEFIIENL